VSNLLKMHILIEISNMWTTRLLQCWVSTFKFKISSELSWLEAVRKKNVRSQQVRGVAQCRHFSDRSLFRCVRPHFL